MSKFCKVQEFVFDGKENPCGNKQDQQGITTHILVIGLNSFINCL